MCQQSQTVFRWALGAVFLLFLLANQATAQLKQNGTDDRSRGIELLNSGDLNGAVNVLRVATKRDKNDLEAWHWLGIALEKQGKPADARKAHEKAGKLGDAMLMSHMDSAGLDSFSEALAKMRPSISLAAESAADFIRLSGKMSKSKNQEWAERYEFLHDIEEFPATTGSDIYKSKEVTTRARVLSKPEPQYTEAARKDQVTGTVVLRAIFAADGRVHAIIPIRRLPDGLTAMSIRAARRIQFIPATKDGKPVSMWMQLEYNFNLY